MAAPSTSNEEVLAWLEGWLEYARGEGRMKLVELLEAVREEVLFELEPAESSTKPQVGRRSS